MKFGLNQAYWDTLVQLISYDPSEILIKKEEDKNQDTAVSTDTHLRENQIQIFYTYIGLPYTYFIF